MIIDVIAIGLVLLAAIVGAFTGALAQLVHLVGLALAWLLGRFAGLRFGPRLAGAIHVPAILGVALLALGVGFVVFVGIHVIGRGLLRRLRHGRGPGRYDRAAGILVGATKSGLVVWLVMSLVVFFDGPLAGLGWKIDTRGSEVASLARRGNLLAHSGLPLPELRKALSNPAALAHSPAMRRLAANKKLEAALQRGDYVTVLKSADVLHILSSPKLRAQIEKAAAAKK